MLILLVVALSTCIRNRRNILVVSAFTDLTLIVAVGSQLTKPNGVDSWFI